MRKSLEHFAGRIQEIPYPRPLPVELVPYHAFLSDSGHIICVIPSVLLTKAIASGHLWKYEVAMPVKYVLKKGYTLVEGHDEKHVVVDAPYSSNIGVMIPDGYTEFDENTSTPPEALNLTKGDVIPWAIRSFEGVQFHVHESSMSLVCLYKKPSEKEIEQFSHGEIQIGTFFEDGILFFLVKPGTEPWQDHPYLPREEEADYLAGFLRNANDNIPLKTMLVDTSTGIIVSDVRTFATPNEFVTTISELAPYLLERRETGMLYLRSAKILQSVYLTDQMAQHGTTYQLQPDQTKE